VPDAAQQQQQELPQPDSPEPADDVVVKRGDDKKPKIRLSKRDEIIRREFILQYTDLKPMQIFALAKERGIPGIRRSIDIHRVLHYQRGLHNGRLPPPTRFAAPATKRSAGRPPAAAARRPSFSKGDRPVRTWSTAAGRAVPPVIVEDAFSDDDAAVDAVAAPIPRSSSQQPAEMTREQKLARLRQLLFEVGYDTALEVIAEFQRVQQGLGKPRSDR
jgi:hypothetical protein